MKTSSVMGRAPPGCARPPDAGEFSLSAASLGSRIGCRNRRKRRNFQAFTPPSRCLHQPPFPLPRSGFSRPSSTRRPSWPRRCRAPPSAKKLRPRPSSSCWCAHPPASARPPPWHRSASAWTRRASPPPGSRSTAPTTTSRAFSTAWPKPCSASAWTSPPATHLSTPWPRSPRTTRPSRSFSTTSRWCRSPPCWASCASWWSTCRGAARS
ncbi:hypothetical protein D9M69_518870 [compost metagenome]